MGEAFTDRKTVLIDYDGAKSWERVFRSGVGMRFTTCLPRSSPWGSGYQEFAASRVFDEDGVV